MSQQVIVLGMHRSYTTLLAKWLHLNGVKMFDPLISTPDYWEDPEILRLHDDFLKAQNMNWLNARAPFEDPSHQFRNRAYQLWQYRDQKFSVWGWKDPRTCILYEFLWSSFSERAKYIVVYRDPAEVVESLLTRKIKKRTKFHSMPDWLYGRYIRRHRKQYDTAFLICWNYFNRCLIHLLAQKDPKDYLVLNAKTIGISQIEIYNRLSENWHIPLSGTTLNALIQPSTIRDTPTLEHLDELILQETTQIMHTLNALQSFRQIDMSTTSQ